MHIFIAYYFLLLSLSAFLPLLILHNGLAVPLGVPGAFPKWVYRFLGPLSNTQLAPVGSFLAIASNVMHSPPDINILSRASLVNLSAQILSFGISSKVVSLVTVEMVTTVFPSFPFVFWIICRSEIGGLLVLESRSLLSMVLGNGEVILLARKR